MGPKCLRCGFDAEGFKVGRAGEDIGVPCLPGEHKWPERKVAEPTVRDDLAEALEEMLALNPIGPHERMIFGKARLVLARHYAEPEQRERVR